MAHHRRILGISAAFVLSMLLPSLTRAGTWVAFQNTYTRGTGAPVTVTDTFTLLNPNTQYTLKAFNGGLQNDTTELVSNSVVFLNGTQVVGPSNFNQSVAEVNVTILPGLTNTLSVQVRGKPGGVLTIQVIGVDNDPPTITASVSPAPNAAGWNNSPVTVTFTCSDKTSGVASCPSPSTVSTEGANQVVSGTATDLAGNTATTSVTINLDMTPPTITGTINPPPDAGGYNSGPVTVTFNCADTLSGVASCSPPVSVTSEASTSETGTAVDVAGNTATTTVTVNISLSYFKIRSWQTGPVGNPKSPSGKCLDYGASPLGNGATVFLNECAVSNPVRVVEIGDRTGNGIDPLTGNPIVLHHEVMLFAGNLVIGINNPPLINPNPGTSPPPPTGYTLELQTPWNARRGGDPLFAPDQIFRLDGDSIILEGTSLDPANPKIVHPGPCINTAASTTLCPAPFPQLVIQVQNARGVNGSPLVASIRNLADNELWDFVPETGSRPYPTGGFQPVASPFPDVLWNALCDSPKVRTGIYPPLISDTGQTDDGTPLIYPCSTSSQGWGSVILVSSPSDCPGVPGPLQGQTQDIGGCLDLSGYPPLLVPAGVTIRGNRRGTNSGPQLYFSLLEWHNLSFSPTNPSRSGGCNEDTCMLEVHGDYVRVTGLHLRGETRATDTTPPKTIGIQVDYPGGAAPLFNVATNLATSTQFIATIDHNEGSDWGESPVEGLPIFAYGIPDSSGHKSNHCTYPGFTDSLNPPNGWYVCDAFGTLVPYPGTNCCGVGVSNDPGTLANIRIARNFFHHNERYEAGYGASVRGRALIEKNTFSWNHHDISADAEPHNEYRASHNLALSGGYGLYSTLDIFLGRQQDFDMHGTDNATTWVGGAGGYNVVIDGNTFLGSTGHDYVMRGYPVNNPAPTNYAQYFGNVSRRNENDAIHFIDCTSIGCVHDYNGPPFPINIYSDNRFADSSPPSIDPASALAVGDFDGDGDDDLFMATGASWYYSPAGRREWRYLNSGPDTIDQLLFGDFDNDGRTDVVAMRNGQLYVSWGGISAFDPLNNTVPPNCTMANMTIGDFNGVGRQTDIFCADPTTMTWWISYGGNTQFAVVNGSGFSRSALRFGHFAVCGTGVETDVFSVQSTGWYVSCGATTLWQRLGPSLSNSADLVVADFDGDGIADVGMPCNSGWQISYGGTQAWSACNTYPSAFSLANGAVGRFSGGPGADILLWNYYTANLFVPKGAATLWDFPGGSGTPYQLSAPDVDAH